MTSNREKNRATCSIQWPKIGPVSSARVRAAKHSMRLWHEAEQRRKKASASNWEALPESSKENYLRAIEAMDAEDSLPPNLELSGLIEGEIKMTSTKYHKIKTLYRRDPTTAFKKIMLGEFSDPVFNYLRNVAWTWTEKVDGMNMRVYWDGEQVSFEGRADNAQIPKKLHTHMAVHFSPLRMKEVFGTRGGVTLYGEGFGAGIRKGGGKYMKDDNSFILFDIAAGGIFWKRSDVAAHASRLGIPVVPVVGEGPLSEAAEFVQEGFSSSLGELEAEGIVMRPRCELQNRLGERVIAKLKCRDFFRVR